MVRLVGLVDLFVGVVGWFGVGLGSFSSSGFGWLFNWLGGWYIGRLAGWLAGWAIGWLVALIDLYLTLNPNPKLLYIAGVPGGSVGDPRAYS